MKKCLFLHENFNRMDIYICTTDLINETSLGLNNDLNTASESRTALGDSIPGLKGEYSLYPGAQLFSDLAGSSVCVPLKCAPHIKVHQVEVR